MHTDTHDTDAVVVCNPSSGSGDHRTEVHARAEERGYDVLETDGEGDARRLDRDDRAVSSAVSS